MANNFTSGLRRNRTPAVHELSKFDTMREPDSVSRARLKTNQTTFQAGSLSNKMSQMEQLARRAAKRNLSLNQFHPFKIYQVPFQYCPPANSIPGYDPTSDSWRTFRVRAGLLGFRSAYHEVSSEGLSGNYEHIRFVLQGSDGGGPTFSGYGGPVGTIVGDFEDDTPSPNPSVDDTVIEVENTGDFGADLGTTGTFVVNSDRSDSGAINASFWVQATETADEDPVIEVKCRMFALTGGDATGRTTQVFPTGPNVWPLGIIGSNYFNPVTGALQAISLSAGQFQFDHLINRYPGCPPTALINGSPGLMASPFYYRGDWDLDNLTGQVFYPGELVSVIGESAITFYLHNGYGIETDQPGLTSAWIRFSEV